MSCTVDGWYEYTALDLPRSTSDVSHAMPHVQPRSRIALSVFGLGIALTTSLPVIGQEAEAPRLRVGWTERAPSIDGRMDAGEWDSGGYISSLTQATPEPGAAASQRTEVWVVTDGETLFLAARLSDTNPEAIIARRMIRDGEIRFDDRLGFTIDPFLDRQNGYFFQVNPNGVRRDSLVEGPRVDSAWDTRWIVRTSIDAEGWTVEIALPFSSINFDPEADVWGFNISRGIRRNDELDRWADPVLDRFVTAMGRAGYLEGMRGLDQGLGVQVVPSTALRRIEDQLRNESDTDVDPSLDAFYKITPSVTGSLTVNTDFSETEVDERQVNLTRFGLFFPEKRDFFLQDALIFDFANLSGNGRPFFSRRIGLGSDGDPRDILVAGKATGRVGPLKIGVLDAVMDERSTVDQTNLFVARVAGNVMGESTVGAVLTHGNPDANGENVLVGGDFNFRDTSFLDNKTVEASLWVQSTWSDPDSLPGSEQLIDGNGIAYGARVSYPNDRVNWMASISEIGDEFQPALGFVNREGIREYKAEYRFRNRPDDGPFRTIDSQIKGTVFTSATSTNTLRTAVLDFIPVILTTPIIDSIELGYTHTYEFTSRVFANLQIPPGEYHFDEGRIKVATSRNRKLRGEFEAFYGTYFDGTRTRATADVEFRPIRHIAFRSQYEFNDIRLPGSNTLSGTNDLDRDVMIHVVRGRVDLLFTPEISLQTLIQFDSLSDSLGFNGRFRWIIEEGREIFLVVNQAASTADDSVRALETELVAKVQWSVRF